MTYPFWMGKESKYKNKKVELSNGEKFDSQKEYNRYIELQFLEKAHQISNLQRQIKYVLIPSQYDGIGKQRKLLERECSYIADFVYYDNDTKEIVVEDVKGMRTKEYIIKRKMMLYFNHIKIKEVN